MQLEILDTIAIYSSTVTWLAYILDMHQCQTCTNVFNIQKE